MRRFVAVILVFTLVFPLNTLAQTFQIRGGALNILGGFTRFFAAYNPTVEPADTTPFVEDVFSTYLYTGTGATQSIINGVNLAGGGLVWGKSRDNAGGALAHGLADTARGIGKFLYSDLTNAEWDSSGNAVASANSNGFTLGSNAQLNRSGDSYVSWTFKEAPGFFDIVTWTGNGSAPRVLSHNLGVRPGMVIIKKTSDTGDWWVTHRAAPNQGAAYTDIGGNLYLNYTDAADNGTNPSLSAMDASTITLSTNQNTTTNAAGATYVAYLFAHDTSADGIIQAGSFTTDGSGNATVDLGWEPQFLMLKASSGTDNWRIEDTRRGLSLTGYSTLVANSSSAESSSSNTTRTLTSTGFSLSSQVAATSYVYLAIRKGPMKTPTNGTEVYSAIARTGTGAAANITGVGFSPDLVWVTGRQALGLGSTQGFDRLRGTPALKASANSAEYTTGSNGFLGFLQDGISLGTDASNNELNYSTRTYIDHYFRRTPWVFDVVGMTSSAFVYTSEHNLGVTPELIIVKDRFYSTIWYVYHKDLGTNKYLTLNTSNQAGDRVSGWSVSDTTISADSFAGDSVSDAVAYLFASKPLVSKVGSYTGNGSTQNINASFSSTARFIMIKRTDSTGDWYVWDSTRGIVSGNDPHISLNSSAAEVTSDDSIDPYNLGFAVNQNATTNINVNGATYIYLAFQ